MCYRITHLFHLSYYKSGIKMQKQGNIWSVLEAELYITVIVSWWYVLEALYDTVIVPCLRSRTVHYSYSFTWWSSKCLYKLWLRIRLSDMKCISTTDKLRGDELTVYICFFKRISSLCWLSLSLKISMRQILKSLGDKLRSSSFSGMSEVTVAFRTQLSFGLMILRVSARSSGQTWSKSFDTRRSACSLIIILYK